MISFTLAMVGKNSFFSPVMTMRPAAPLAAMRSSTCATLAAVGFSIQTWTPAASASSAIPVACTEPSGL